MNEVGTPGPEQEPVPEVPDLSTPNADIVLDCQAHTHVTQQRKDPKIGTAEIEGRIVGRDQRVVPPEDVFKLAAIGCKDIEIADWFGIDSNTLRYNFSVELLKGREKLKQSLRRKQIEVAMGGNVVMLIFLGKNLLGQSDNPLAAENTAILPWEDQ